MEETLYEKQQQRKPAKGNRETSWVDLRGKREEGEEEIPKIKVFGAKGGSRAKKENHKEGSSENSLQNLWRESKK